MNSKEIQDILMIESYTKPIQITNYSGIGYEADVLMITKAGLAYEYEVKTSRNDFKKDFTKNRKHRIYSDSRPHLIRRRNYPEKPNYFYYVCKAGLINVTEIPEYAGLIYVTEDRRLEVVKKAPKLHTYKFPDSMIWNIASTLTARVKFGCSYIRHKHSTTSHDQTS